MMARFHGTTSRRRALSTGARSLSRGIFLEFSGPRGRGRPFRAHAFHENALPTARQHGLDAGPGLRELPGSEIAGALHVGAAEVGPGKRRVSELRAFEHGVVED